MVTDTRSHERVGFVQSFGKCGAELPKAFLTLGSWTTAV